VLYRRYDCRFIPKKGTIVVDQVDVNFGCNLRIHAGPWRLAAEMRLGEVPFAAGVEQVLDSVEVIGLWLCAVSN
jgi:hypothetical protein